MQRIVEKLKLDKLVQFIKFGIVGLSNTAISYGIEMLCFYVLFKNEKFPKLVSFLSGLGIKTAAEPVRILLTTVLAFMISATNSYYWNNRCVFTSKERKTPRQHIRSYLRTVICYGATGLVLSPAIKLWLSGIEVPYWLASISSLIVTIPLNFVLNKFWAFGNKMTPDQAPPEGKGGEE